MDQDTSSSMEDIVSMRLDEVRQPNAEAGLVSLEPLERAEVDDLAIREIELLGNVAEKEESEGDIKKGASFEVVKDDLKVIADEGTTEKYRNAKIVALEIEKNLTFSDEINYSGADNASKTEREKIRNAIKAVDTGEVVGWGSVEEAKRFLEEDLNVSFEDVVAEEDEESVYTEEDRREFLSDRFRVSRAITSVVNSKGRSAGLREDMEQLGFVIDDGYFEGEDLNIGWKKDNRRQAILDVANDLKEGTINDNLNQVLEKMGVDVAANADIIESWFKEDDSEIPKKLTEYITKFDKELNVLLLQEWDTRLVGVVDNKTRILEMYERSNISKGELKEIRRKMESGDPTVWPEMFEVAQEMYLKDLCGVGMLREREVERDNLRRRQGEIDPKNDDETNKFNTDRGNHYGRLETIANSAAKNTARNPIRSWDVSKPEGQDMVDRLHSFLIEKFSVPELVRDNTNLGLLQRVLNEYKPGSDPDTWVDRKQEKDNTLGDNEKELLTQFATFRRFVHRFDTAGEVEKNSEKVIDKALRSMLTIQNVAGKDPSNPIAEAVILYQRILRDEHSFTKNKATDIDSDRVRNLFKAEYLKEFKNTDYVDLAMSLGRDVVRLTGMDTKYSIAEHRNDKGELITPDSPSGGLLRDVFNLKTILKEKPLVFDPLLVSGIDLGVVPFWNKLRDTPADDPSTKLSLSHVDFRNAQEVLDLVNTKIVEGGKVFGDWASAMPEKVKAQIDAEKKFISEPSLSSYYSSLVGVDIEKATKRKDYLIKRLGNYVDYVKTKNDDWRVRLKNEFDAYFYDKDGNFVSKTFFPNYKDLSTLTQYYGFSIKTENALLNALQPTTISVDDLSGVNGPHMQKERAKKVGSQALGFLGDILSIFSKNYK